MARKPDKANGVRERVTLTVRRGGSRVVGAPETAPATGEPEAPPEAKRDSEE